MRLGNGNNVFQLKFLMVKDDSIHQVVESQATGSIYQSHLHRLHPHHLRSNRNKDYVPSFLQGETERMRKSPHRHTNKLHLGPRLCHLQITLPVPVLPCLARILGAGEVVPHLRLVMEELQLEGEEVKEYSPIKGDHHMRLLELRIERNAL
jgi:hypothetical protein